MIQGQCDESLHIKIEFGAKSSSGSSLNNANLVILKGQERHEFLMIVMGILSGGIHHQGAVVIDEPGSGIGFQVVVFHHGSSIGFFNNALAPLERSLRIPSANFAYG